MSTQSLTRMTRIRRLALSLCRSCGVYPPDVEDVAEDIVRRSWRHPVRMQGMVAMETLRRHLCRQLRRPRRALGRSALRLKAVGEYEALRSEYLQELTDAHGRWIRAFDAHDRRFAEANGVCPRCARPGDFAAPSARCECGFGMGG